MKGLKTPFQQGGRITAANASQISDGAAAVMLVSGMDALNSHLALHSPLTAHHSLFFIGRKLKELSLKPLARIVACVTVGSDPEYMLTGTPLISSLLFVLPPLPSPFFFLLFTSPL